VSGALRTLSARGLINYTPYGLITLTPAGTALARDVVRRHAALKGFFVKILHIDEETAEKAACQMEHFIPPVVVDRLLQFGEFLEICPRGGRQWLQEFQHFCQGASKSRACEECISRCLEDWEEKHPPEGPRTLPLPELPPGHKGIIVTVDTTREPGRVVWELGLKPGTIVEMESLGPYGEPVSVKFLGYHYSLARPEAEAVTVELP